MAKQSGLVVEPREVQIPVGDRVIMGDLAVGENTLGIVLFAHGSGSSRFSPRNHFVANVLQQRGLATLLVDLLTAEEEALDLATAQLRFDIAFLTQRVVAVIDWLEANPDAQHLKLGLFGASTGAAAALMAAVERSGCVEAVVSRGGRPDLARSALYRVEAPTLLIVGGYDSVVLDLNREAFRMLACDKKLAVVPEATHLFEEPGALEEVAHLAEDWFGRYLA